MKQIFRGFALLVLALLIYSQTVNACDIKAVPLRKEFRNSKNVFVAEVLDISDAPKSFKNPKDREVNGVIKFKIEKRWKGAKQKEISLLTNVGCGFCYEFKYFEKGKKYLVFTEENYISFCSAGETKDDYVKIKMNRLDNFGFRVWARIYPF